MAHKSEFWTYSHLTKICKNALDKTPIETVFFVSKEGRLAWLAGLQQPTSSTLRKKCPLAAKNGKLLL